ncbi:hypothetical protein D3C86_1067390 [compost metagenome]|jgi:hypothetical protein
MTSWLLVILIALAVGGLGAALLRQPGVVLYDWLARPAEKPVSVAKAPLKNEGHEPATQAG